MEKQQCSASGLSRGELKTLGLSSLGGILEFYDFIIVFFFAKIISQHFFPAGIGEFWAMLNTYGTFAAGYLARPLGGVVMAHFGDKFGRKNMFMLSIALMVIPTFSLAVIPTYETIGYAAPLFLILVRICQGIAIGGELPGAWVFIHEHAPAGHKNAFVGSGIRYDLFDDSPYLETVVKHHTSGRLKVAPEHTEDAVLKLMRKPPFALFEQLNADFQHICRREGLPYQLIPYFISSHPGCTERDMRSLSAKVLGKLHFNLEQVQDLTPTPMTLSSVMFYTGENPYTHEKVYVARSQEEKRRQKGYFFNEKPSSKTFQKYRRRN